LSQHLASSLVSAFATTSSHLQCFALFQRNVLKLVVVQQIQDLQQVCPELTEEEAERALELCNGR